MANRRTPFRKLNERSPWIVRQRITNALKKAEGNVSRAARILELSQRQLRRYMLIHSLEGKVDEIRGKTGWYKKAQRGGKKRTRYLAQLSKRLETQAG